jgi:hypothetical protein
MLPIGVGKSAGSDLPALLHCIPQVQRQTQHRPGRISTARSMKFCSSRILPGQSCALRTPPLHRESEAGSKFATKNCVSGGMSRTRSRSGGRQIGITFKPVEQVCTKQPLGHQLPDPGWWPPLPARSRGRSGRYPNARTPALAGRAGAWAGVPTACPPISSRKSVQPSAI